jgi:hypothetical protein
MTDPGGGTSRPATADDLQRIVRALNEQGARYLLIGAYALADQSARYIDPAWFTEGDNIRVADEVTVDLLFSPCAQTYEMLEPYAQVIDLGGVPVRTVSLRGLLLTKQTQRPQDIQDCLVLSRAIDAQGSGQRHDAHASPSAGDPDA